MKNGRKLDELSLKLNVWMWLLIVYILQPQLNINNDKIDRDTTWPVDVGSVDVITTDYSLLGLEVAVEF